MTRRGFSSGLLALIAAACGGKIDGEGDSPSAPSTPTHDDPPPDFPGTAAPAPDPGLGFGPAASLAVPSVIWSWTTAAQAAEVRAGGVLFTVDSSPTMGRGYLFDVLQKLADGGDAAATRLVGPELSKGRFGWHNPWATVRGATDGESYGLELLAITMKPDTLYALVSASGGVLGFVDATGNAVAIDAALAAWDRVGGILFHNDIDSNQLCSTVGSRGTAAGGGAMIYREIYIGNEAQIASFSHKTQDILDAITSSAASLVSLRDWMKTASFSKTTLDWECFASQLWTYLTPQSSVERYLASLAFATPLYTPTPVNLDAIVGELVKARFVVDPFTH